MLSILKSFFAAMAPCNQMRAVPAKNSVRLNLEGLEARDCPSGTGTGTGTPPPPPPNVWTVDVLTDAASGTGGQGNLANQTGDLRFCVNNDITQIPIVFANNLSGTLTLKDSIDITTTTSIIGSSNIVITQNSGITPFIVAPNQVGSLTLNNVTIDNSVVAQGQSGGAILAQDRGSLNVYGCTFDGDQAGLGGAICCADGSIVQVGNYLNGSTSTPTTFTNNSAIAAGAAPGDGGAIYVGGSANLQVQGASFYGNSAAGDGGAIDVVGAGGIAASATITSTTFSDNSAGGRGGAICALQCNVLLQIDVIDYNTAANGGGIYVGGGTFAFDNAGNGNTIQNDTASVSGGGITIDSGTVQVNGTLNVANNSAPANMGNGIYLNNNATLQVMGTIIYTNDSLVTYD